MLENEYKYFEEHYEDIKKKFLGKFVVIIGEEIIGEYESQKEALSETLKTHKLGTFLVQEVTEKRQDNIQRFTSRVYV